VFRDHLLFICQSIFQLVAYGLDSRSARVDFVADEVTVEQVFLSLLWLSRVSIFAPNLHTSSFVYHCCYVVLAIDSVVK